MSGQRPFRPYSRAPAAFRAGACAVPARDSPEENDLLAALPAAELARLLPVLELVPLPSGWTIHGPGDRETDLYFPTSGIVSRAYVTDTGAAAGYSIVGSEGVIGVALFLCGGRTLGRAEVISAGYAYRLSEALLRERFVPDGPLPRLLLRYTQALVAQTGQNAACNRHHSLEQRLCRWILSCLDRLPSGELAMTQELIAEMLGVRREGVTAAAGTLQKAGLIHCDRGRIVVLDRAPLEARVCECYAVVRREFDRLLPDRTHLRQRRPVRQELPSPCRLTDASPALA